MRKTDQAQQQFRMASPWSENREGESYFSAESIHHAHVAAGLALLAEAIRDIYDKLESIEKDVRTLSTNTMQFRR
jgi:hypothetical protein